MSSVKKWKNNVKQVVYNNLRKGKIPINYVQKILDDINEMNTKTSGKIIYCRRAKQKHLTSNGKN